MQHNLVLVSSVCTISGLYSVQCIVFYQTIMDMIL